jgi:chaperonin GroES
MASKKKAKKPATKKSIKTKAVVKKAVVKKAKAAPKKTVAKKSKPAAKKAVPKAKLGKKAAVQKSSSKTKTKNTVQKNVIKSALPISAKNYSEVITPLGDRLVVRVENNERVTAGGLIIPDTVSEAVGFLKARVLAVGRGTQNKKGFIKTMDVQVGDSVLFSQYAGTKVQFNSEELQIIHETDVMGIVQK